MSTPISEDSLAPAERESAVPFSWVGELLISLRKQQGLTQAELGKRLGMHQAAIARWENSKYRTVSLESINQVIQALEVEIIVLSSNASNFRAPDESLPNS